MKKPIIAEITAPNGIENQKGIPNFVVRIAEAYAPIAQNAAWHRDICPVYPITKSKPIARMIKIQTRLLT